MMLALMCKLLNRKLFLINIELKFQNCIDLHKLSVQGVHKIGGNTMCNSIFMYKIVDQEFVKYKKKSLAVT